MAGLGSFILGELTTLVAPSDVVLARGSAGMPMASLPAVGGSTTSAAPSLGGDPRATRKVVRIRRAVAAYWVLFTVALPALPVVVTVVRALTGSTDAVAEVATGAVLVLPCAFVGLVVGAKLAPLWLRVLGLTMPKETKPVLSFETAAASTSTRAVRWKTFALWIVLIAGATALYRVLGAP